MSVIYKFPLQIVDDQMVEMPAGARMLTAQVQRDAVCLWAMVSAGARQVKRHIKIVGTGHPVDALSVGLYIATFQIKNAQLVFHVFDAGEVA